jgi:hypothetical protein
MMERTDKNHRKIFNRTVGVLVEIRKGHLPSTSQMGYRFNQAALIIISYMTERAASHCILRMEATKHKHFKNYWSYFVISFCETKCILSELKNVDIQLPGFQPPLQTLLHQAALAYKITGTPE